MRDEFFLDEVRDGFFVPSMMKKTWAVEIRDTQKLIEKCKELNITCFTAFGSMIGVVRHGGYIPWDDDIDMEMTREAFDKLKSEVGTEYNDNEFFVNTYEQMQDENLVRKWLQVNNALRHPDEWKDYFGYPFGMMIDIFMVDFMPSDKEELELYTRVLEVTLGLKMKAQELEKYRKELEEDPDGEHEPCIVDEKEFEKDLEIIEEVLVRKIDRSKKGYDFWIQLVHELEDLCGEYKANDPRTEYASKMSYYVRNKGLLCPKYYYSDYVELPFEEGSMPVVIGYDGFLRTWFGNAMRPEMISGAHAYPFYDKMRSDLYDKYGIDILHYSFDKDRYESVMSLRDEKPDHVSGIIESLGLFAEAHTVIRDGYSNREKRDEILDLLAQCQNLAISVGESIENRIVDGESMVEAIEQYCESLFRLYQLLSENSDPNPEDDEDLAFLNLFERKTEEFVQKDLATKKEVVFLCMNPKEWRSLHSLWQEAMSDETCHVTVIPVPHYYKDFEGNMREDRLHLFEEGYPEEVRLTHHDEYNFRENHPDIVFYQCPYDEFSDSISADILFYAVNIRQYVERMVFVQPFVLGERYFGLEQSNYTLGVFMKNPGVVFADDIIVQSDAMKDTCVKILDSFIIDSLEETERQSEQPDEKDQKDKKDSKDESADDEEKIKTQDLIDWDKRIHAWGSSVYDWESRSRVLLRNESTSVCYDKETGEKCLPTVYDEVIDLPDEWLERLRRPDGSMKRVLLYFLGASMLLDYQKDGIDKAKRLLKRIKEEEKDVVVIWKTDINARQILRKHASSAWSGYRDLMTWFEKNEIGILDKDMSVKSLGAIADGYYGDADRLMSEVRIRKNPVIWEEPGVDPCGESAGDEIRRWDPDWLVVMESSWSFSELLEELKDHKTLKPEDGNGKRIWSMIRESE